MKLSEVTILRRETYPFEVEKSPSKSTLSFLSSLIHSKYLNEEIEDSRLTSQGADMSPKKLTMQMVSAYEDAHLDDLRHITRVYELPESFSLQFALLLGFHMFIDLFPSSDFNLYYLENSAEILERMREIEKDELQNIGAIMLEHRVTKEQLIDYINGNWDEISEQMEALPNYPRMDKFTNIALSEEIYNLHLQGKPVSKIADILSKKYPDNELLWDEGWIKNKLSRYQKRIKELDSKYPQADRSDS